MQHLNLASIISRHSPNTITFLFISRCVRALVWPRSYYTPGKWESLVIQRRLVPGRHAETASRASIGIRGSNPLRSQFVVIGPTVIHFGAGKDCFAGWEFGARTQISYSQCSGDGKVP